MLSKGLVLMTNCETPIIVVLSGDDAYGFRDFGDLILSTNYPTESIRAGDNVVFLIEGGDIPITHRVIKLHEKNDGSIKFLTHGDGNHIDDRGLYSSGQLWLERKDIIGKVKGYVPYIGLIIILLAKIPLLNLLISVTIGGIS
ncbi:unnamed protein product [Adineta steineri]|uniref:Signal peptidase complex catalytic subunit SEC11 n=1 Tax=Adineta steineri TaxID=433720 RepID=A0A813MK64_9BILA|nr:unnamed protein product [Adineta steineri]